MILPSNEIVMRLLQFYYAAKLILSFKGLGTMFFLLKYLSNFYEIPRHL